jgi:hypothetical protein
MSSGKWLRFEQRVKLRYSKLQSSPMEGGRAVMHCSPVRLRVVRLVRLLKSKSVNALAVVHSQRLQHRQLPWLHSKEVLQVLTVLQQHSTAQRSTRVLSIASYTSCRYIRM